MARVTLSVLEGLERGRVYRDLETPITIGREQDNHIQLNDERISRLHAKLQEDQGQVILTDLNSTNGSRVNGHPVQLRVLRAGDHVQLGRCTLMFGSEQELADRARRLGVDVTALKPLDGPSHKSVPAGGLHDADFSVAENVNGDHLLFPLFHGERPPLPNQLDTGQRARFCDVLTYVHERLADVILESRSQDDPSDGSMNVPWERWQNLQLLTRDLASYLQEIANPDESP